MVDPGAALAAAKQLDDAVGLVGKLIGKLKQQPDLAALKLGQALDEVAKTLQAVDAAISKFLSLGIDEGALQKNSQPLLEIEGGGLGTAVESGRGHCHVIGNIYSQHLDRWFQRVLETNDYKEIERVFGDLGNADADLFQGLTGVAGLLKLEAANVLDLVIAGDVKAARDRVLSVRPVVRPLRQTMARTMQSLYRLKEQFVEITGVA